MSVKSERANTVGLPGLLKWFCLGICVLIALAMIITLGGTVYWYPESDGLAHVAALGGGKLILIAVESAPFEHGLGWDRPTNWQWRPSFIWLGDGYTLFLPLWCVLAPLALVTVGLFRLDRRLAVQKL